MKNDYKELYNNFSIYAYGLEQANYYNIWTINETDYYSINIENIKEKYKHSKKDRDRPGYFLLGLNETYFNFALLEIFSYYEETLEVLFNFNSELIPLPSLDIYSYQSFYLKTNHTKHFDFNYASENKYTIIINNTSGDGYIYFNQNPNDDEQKIQFSENFILSYTISEKIKSIHLFSENYLFFYMKIKNKIPNDIMEELNYGSNYKNITKEYIYSKAFYIKDIYGNGVDINFFFNNKSTNFYNNYINIYGYIVNYDDIKYINNYESLQQKLDELCFQQINGIFDNFTKTGLITFDNNVPKNEFNKEDKYYLIVFFYSSDYISEFSVDIYVDSIDESRLILQGNRYIRGGFNLLSDMNIQSKTFFIELKGERYLSINDDYTLEFSSNFENIKPIFNNEFNYSRISKIGKVQKYHFSKENLQERKKYNFTIELNKTNNDIDIWEAYNLVANNYIIKFYKEEKYSNMDFIKNKDIEKKRIGDTNEEYSKYNFTIRNKEKQNYNLNKNFKFIYFANICYKQSLYETQILNSIAINNNCNNHKYDFETDDLNKEFTFSVDLENNEYYYAYLFMIVKDKNGDEEKYFSICTEFETKEKNKTNTKLIIIISVVFGITFIIAISIFVIVCNEYKKKNQNLKEQIQTISFNKGIDGSEKDSSDYSDKEIIFI